MISKIILFFSLFISFNIFGKSLFLDHLTQNQIDELLTNPQKKNRKCMCQFGYDLKYFHFMAGFRIGQILKKDKYGVHNYSKPSGKEKNGQIYTCRGAFIDTSHARASADWTIHFYTLLSQKKNKFEYNQDESNIKFTIHHFPESTEEMIALSQRMAYERLIFHEMMSWYYHKPSHRFSEQQSTFSPEDNYSNLLGSYWAHDAIIAIESGKSKNFEEAITVAMKNSLEMLGAVSKKQTKKAFDLMDQHKSENKSLKKNFCYTSRTLLTNHRYLFKRHMEAFGNEEGKLVPWTLFSTATIKSCEGSASAYLLSLPSPNQNDYTLSVEINKEFLDIVEGQKERHPKGSLPASFTAKEFPSIIKNYIYPEMEAELGLGFDVR